MENQEPNPPLPNDWKPLDIELFVPLCSRDELIAHLKKEHPGITDEELEAYGA